MHAAHQGLRSSKASPTLLEKGEEGRSKVLKWKVPARRRLEKKTGGPFEVAREETMVGRTQRPEGNGRGQGSGAKGQLALLANTASAEREKK